MKELPREELPEMTHDEQAAKIKALTRSLQQMRMKRDMAVRKLRVQGSGECLSH